MNQNTRNKFLIQLRLSHEKRKPEINNSEDTGKWMSKELKDKRIGYNVRREFPDCRRPENMFNFNPNYRKIKPETTTQTRKHRNHRSISPQRIDGKDF